MKYNVGDFVLFGCVVYVVIKVSDEPIIKFDDGSLHYQCTIRRLNAQDSSDIVCVNDYQIRRIEKEVFNNECKIEREPLIRRNLTSTG